MITLRGVAEWRSRNIKVRNKTLDQHFDANLKNPFFAKFWIKLVTFLKFFCFFAWKMQKMTISTSSWGAQHPNAGRNIQQHGQATFLFSMIWYFCEKRVSAEDRHGCHSKNKPFFYFFFCQIYCYCDTFVRPVFLICQIKLYAKPQKDRIIFILFANLANLNCALIFDSEKNMVSCPALGGR